MYILVFSFQFMADKDSQRNADGEEYDETAEQLPQPYAVQDTRWCLPGSRCMAGPPLLVRGAEPALVREQAREVL